MTLALEPVRVVTGAEDEGQLVYQDEGLVAVLVRLSELHEEIAGHWFLEAGFGRLQGLHPTFIDLDAARIWIADRLQPRAGNGRRG